ncbi:hypothetical protein OUZ56_018742, partial [Daphnia magna]
ELLSNSQKDKPDISQPTISDVHENPVSTSRTKQSRKRSHSTDSNKEDDNFDQCVELPPLDKLLEEPSRPISAESFLSVDDPLT